MYLKETDRPLYTQQNKEEINEELRRILHQTKTQSCIIQPTD